MKQRQDNGQKPEASKQCGQSWRLVEGLEKVDYAWGVAVSTIDGTPTLAVSMIEANKIVVYASVSDQHTPITAYWCADPCFDTGTAGLTSPCNTWARTS